jgi:hypothetical protein
MDLTQYSARRPVNRAITSERCSATVVNPAFLSESNSIPRGRIQP